MWKRKGPRFFKWGATTGIHTNLCLNEITCRLFCSQKCDYPAWPQLSRDNSIEAWSILLSFQQGFVKKIRVSLFTCTDLNWMLGCPCVQWTDIHVSYRNCSRLIALQLLIPLCWLPFVVRISCPCAQLVKILSVQSLHHLSGVLFLLGWEEEKQDKISSLTTAQRRRDAKIGDGSVGKSWIWLWHLTGLDTQNKNLFGGASSSRDPTPVGNVRHDARKRPCQ